MTAGLPFFEEWTMPPRSSLAQFCVGPVPTQPRYQG
jgi:hypothetical protein